MARPSRFRGPEYWRRFVPPGQQQVDWNNPLCADLRVLAQLSGPRSIDLVTGGESTTLNADPTSGSTPFGQASIFAGAQGQQFTHAVSDSQFSGAALIQSTTSGANQTIIDYDVGGASRIFQFRINTSNQLEYIAFDSVPNAYSVTASLPDFQNGTPVGFSAGGATVRLLAGENVTDTTIGGTQVTLASTHSPIVGYRAGGGTTFTGGISMYALWGRMLSAEEWLEWARYPGQLFKPLARRVISFSATSVIALTGASAESASTTSTAALSQTHVLAGADATSASTASTAALAQVHALTGASAESASTVSTAALTQAHTLAGANATSASEASAGAISLTVDLIGTAAESASAASTGALTQTHVLIGANAESVGEASAWVLVQVQTLAGADAVAAAEASTGAVRGAETILEGANAEAATEASTGSIHTFEVSPSFAADFVADFAAAAKGTLTDRAVWRSADGSASALDGFFDQEFGSDLNSRAQPARYQFAMFEGDDPGVAIGDSLVVGGVEYAVAHRQVDRAVGEIILQLQRA